MSLLTRPLLVFDLDETLLHARDKDFRESQHETQHGFVAIRDGVDDLLERVHPNFDLMVWSNSKIEYIQDMLALFWPKKIPLVDIFTSSESGIKGFDGVGIAHYKDMKKICKAYPQYTLSRIVGVDDKPDVYSRNYGNLVAVTPFRGKPDQELGKLADFLIELAGKENFRAVEKRYWRKTPVEADQVLSP